MNNVRFGRFRIGLNTQYSTVVFLSSGDTKTIIPERYWNLKPLFVTMIYLLGEYFAH